jgi:hypothetical protein
MHQKTFFHTSVNLLQAQEAGLADTSLRHAFTTMFASGGNLTPTSTAVLGRSETAIGTVPDCAFFRTLLWDYGYRSCWRGAPGSARAGAECAAQRSLEKGKACVHHESQIPPFISLAGHFERLAWSWRQHSDCVRR